jgi:hypothetical protein
VDKLFGGDADGALIHIDAGLGMLPGEENPRFVRAGALLARGDLEGWREELRHLVAARPSYFPLKNPRGGS